MIKYCFSLLAFYSIDILADVTVYKWTDKENIVHFSQHQPNAEDYIELTIMSNGNQRIISNPQSRRPQLSTNNEKALKNLIDIEKCQEAQKNIEVLAKYQNVQYTDTVGNIKLLSDEEISDQLIANREKADIHCP